MSVLLMGAPAGALTVGGGLGAVGAWWAHRRTRLSAWNLYPLAPLAVAAWLAVIAARRVELLPGAGLLCAAGVAAAVRARRYRLAALGAGGELREFERARVMAWSLLRARERAGSARGSWGRASWSASARGTRGSRWWR
jgi:hypothetical protein